MRLVCNLLAGSHHQGSDDSDGPVITAQAGSSRIPCFEPFSEPLLRSSGSAFHQDAQSAVEERFVGGVPMGSWLLRCVCPALLVVAVALAPALVAEGQVGLLDAAGRTSESSSAAEGSAPNALSPEFELRLWLASREAEQSTRRDIYGAITASLGVFGMLAGGWIALEDGAFIDQQARPILAASVLSLGASLLVDGILGWISPLSAHEVRRELPSTLGALDVARIEGHLRAEAEQSSHAIDRSIWIGIALLMAGISVVGLTTAAAPEGSPRDWAIAAGSALVGVSGVVL